MAKVILDANVVIGHLDDQDSLHDRAEALAERIRANGDTLQVIDLTLQEAISVLCRRTTQRKQSPPNLPQILQRVRVWLERGLVGFTQSKLEPLFSEVLELIEHDQQPNQDVGIKRLHGRVLRLQWRFACQPAKRGRPQTGE